jgi:sialic acid synthase SpsE
MKANSVMQIDGVSIGDDHPVYFIADIAANHDGDLSRAKDLIYLAAESGAHAAKFQHFTADTIVSDIGFRSLNNLSSHQSNWSKSVYDVYKSAALELNWTEVLVETCKKAGISFFTSPYSLELVDFIDSYVPAYKIGSGDITWIEIVEHIARKNKPYIIASGASDISDVHRVMASAISINPNVCLMQCNTNYTAKLENFKHINLRVLNLYRQMYPNLILGLSDHTPGHSTVLGAITLGARMVEKHFTDDIKRSGPDHVFSMDRKSWREMVDRSCELQFALGNGIKKIEANEAETVVLQRRSIRAKKNILAGSLFQKQDFELLRPCPLNALPPYRIDDIYGKVCRRDISLGDYLTCQDLED